MKSFGILALALVSTFAFSGCNDPMKDYVEQSVKLDPSKQLAPGGAGTLVFTQVSYSTEYQQVCDHYECGGYEQICSGGGQTVCTGGGQVCEPVQRCTASGCTTDSVCHTVPQTCHTSTPVCQSEYVSRTCDTNCREEPYQVRHETPIQSAISLEIKGGDASKVENLSLGVKTNDKFIAAFDDPTQRPKNLGYLWDSLSKTDKTVLVMKSKGFQLVKGQSFLDVPADFRPGDTVKVEVQIEPSGSDQDGVTAVGTSTDFPALEF
jgi:hypothetical protein